MGDFSPVLGKLIGVLKLLRASDAGPSSQILVWRCELSKPTGS